MGEIIFIDIKHIIHFSSVKFNETIISVQIKAIFPLLSVVSLDIFHMIKIGQ